MRVSSKWEIIQGDALKVLEGFPSGTFDAVITDPPYASGGRTQAEKNRSTAKKYSSMGDPDLSGAETLHPFLHRHGILPVRVKRPGSTEALLLS